jgi:hypothetical protein
MVGFRHVLQRSAAVDRPPQHTRRTMPTAADLRSAIDAARAGDANTAQLAMLADATATLLPDPVTISKYFVLLAWLDGSRRRQPGYEPYDSLDLANGAAAIKQASADYASVTVSAPLSITLPGAGPVAVAVATTASPDVAATSQ